nr:a3.1 [Pseudozyma thailandica]
MYSIFETVAAAVQVVAAAEVEQNPTEQVKGVPAPYCVIA